MIPHTRAFASMSGRRNERGNAYRNGSVTRNAGMHVGNENAQEEAEQCRQGREQGRMGEFKQATYSVHKINTIRQINTKF